VAISHSSRPHWYRTRALAGLFSFGIALIFFLPLPAHAWGAFNDVWVQSDTTSSFDYALHPASSQIVEPSVGGQVNISLGFVSSTAANAAYVDFRWNEDLISGCEAAFPGSVPVLLNVAVTGDGGFGSEMYPWRINGSVEDASSLWSSWSDPTQFLHITGYWYPVPGVDDVPVRAALQMTCATQNGANVQYRNPPDGTSSGWYSYDFENVDYFVHDNFASEILNQLQNATTTQGVRDQLDPALVRAMDWVSQLSYKWPWGYGPRIKDAFFSAYVSSQSADGLELSVNFSSGDFQMATTTILSADNMSDAGVPLTPWRDLSTTLIWLAFGMWLIMFIADFISEIYL